MSIDCAQLDACTVQIHWACSWREIELSRMGLKDRCFNDVCLQKRAQNICDRTRKE